MGFNRQRPDSLSSELKRISVEFTPEGQNREKQLISEYINQVCYGESSQFVNIDDWRVLSTVEESTRKTQRVKFNNCYVYAITIKAGTNKVIKVRCELIDLSPGGACIGIPGNLKVVSRRKAVNSQIDDPPNIKLKLDFINDVVVKGVIRSLKNPKVDPSADLDNYDFEYTLPEYWKVNG